MESEGPITSFLDGMKKRDQQRKQVIEDQKAKKAHSKTEGVDYFDSVFDKKVIEINTKLDALQPGDDLNLIQNEFTFAGGELKDLQKYFTSSTLFLNDRKIQNCQDTINQLITKVEDLKSILMPKKKFGFKNKSTAVNPAKMESKVDGVVKESMKEFVYTETGKRNQIIELTSDVTNSQDLTFKDIENCVIIIKGHPGSVQLSKIKNCIIFSGPIIRSLFADNCENCTFAMTCQQLRLHSSKSCRIYIHVTSRAIIEDCSEISFAPSTYSYDGYDEDITQSGLDMQTNNWENIGDFNWLSTDKQSPNWSKIDENEKISDWQNFIDKFKKLNEITQ